MVLVLELIILCLDLLVLGEELFAMAKHVLADSEGFVEVLFDNFNLGVDFNKFFFWIIADNSGQFSFVYECLSYRILVSQNLLLEEIKIGEHQRGVLITIIIVWRGNKLILSRRNPNLISR